MMHPTTGLSGSLPLVARLPAPGQDSDTRRKKCNELAKYTTASLRVLARADHRVRRGGHPAPARCGVDPAVLGRGRPDLVCQRPPPGRLAVLVLAPERILANPVSPYIGCAPVCTPVTNAHPVCR